MFCNHFHKTFFHKLTLFSVGWSSERLSTLTQMLTLLKKPAVGGRAHIDITIINVTFCVWWSAVTVLGHKGLICWVLMVKVRDRAEAKYAVIRPWCWLRLGPRWLTFSALSKQVATLIGCFLYCSVGWDSRNEGALSLPGPFWPSRRDLRCCQ